MADIDRLKNRVGLSHPQYVESVSAVISEEAFSASV